MPTPKSLPGLPADYVPQFFPGDIVSKASDPTFRAQILRCWGEEDDEVYDDFPGSSSINRPLLRGEVGIMRNDSACSRGIIPESELVLEQRDFFLGDPVKKDILDLESGMIVDIKHEYKLADAGFGAPPDDWQPLEALESAYGVEGDCKVVYDEWVGTVEGIIDMYQIRSKQTGEIYTKVHEGPRCPLGVLPDFDSSNVPEPRFYGEDIVIGTVCCGLYISWNAINQQISPRESEEKHQPPKRLWTGKDIAKLVFIKSLARTEFSMTYSVRFKNTTSTAVPYRIIGCRTTATVRWQSGHVTSHDANELIPHRLMDDYETWPGEYVKWTDEDGEKNLAVVQSYNSSQRIAKLLDLKSRKLVEVSYLEMDIGDSEEGGMFGIGLNHEVLLCEDNGSVGDRAPSLGTSDVHLYHGCWHQELLNLIKENHLPFEDHPIPGGDTSKIKWFGVVKSLGLDGLITVALGDGSTTKVSLDKIYRLSHHGEDEHLDHEGEDSHDWEDCDSDFDMNDLDLSDRAAIEKRLKDAAGNPTKMMSLIKGLYTAMETYVGASSLPDKFKDRLKALKDSYIKHSKPNLGGPVETPAAEVVDSDDDSLMDIDDVDKSMGEIQSTLGSADTISSAIPLYGNGAEAGPSGSSGTSSHTINGSMTEIDWKGFEMLETAPADHHYIKEKRSEASGRQYLSRIRKEHQSLASSLPENIIVRTYEDRVDLLRALIIGPEGTPYANAPFVFDLYLNPQTFPQQPPVVFFHSHTNGQGRCNPNLYEEGKVCLSILGTWSGDASESWNPTNSSLLQVLVSISGLVLVRSPYHCEPAFAKLEGTKEGKINSRLYSEKAYVLSRAFVRQALLHPPEGLANEIKDFYLRNDRLRVVIDHAQRLIDKGEVDDTAETEEGMWDADAIGRLTMGAIIVLRRTIIFLKKILNEQEEGQSK